MTTEEMLFQLLRWMASIKMCALVLWLNSENKSPLIPGFG